MSKALGNIELLLVFLCLLQYPGGLYLRRLNDLGCFRLRLLNLRDSLPGSLLVFFLFAAPVLVLAPVDTQHRKGVAVTFIKNVTFNNIVTIFFFRPGGAFT